MIQRCYIPFTSSWQLSQRTSSLKRKHNSTKGQRGVTIMLTLATSLLGLVDGFDDTDGNSLSHVTDGETTERRILVVRLNTLVGITASVAAE